ncbi:MAG: M23 family metallopeptidase [Patescibacteria group bacterium]|nr:M23 family metallopeptidase [Patescibacteria group bacterium]
MPIFLVVILVLGGVVYAVPSFRAKFTGFLKYFGPKAETGCTTLECTNALISSSATPTTAPPSPDENDWQCGYSPNNGRNNSRNINKEFKNYRFDKVIIGGWIINTYRFLYPACQAGVTPEQYIRSGVAYPCTVSGGYENSEETVSQFTYFPQDLVQIDNIDILEKNKCQILIKNSETYSLKISSDGGTQSVIPERMPRMPQGSLLEHDHVGDQINFKFSQSGLYDILATFFNQAQIGVKINATKLGFKLNDVTQANQAQEITLGQNSSTVRPIQNLGSANYTNTDYKEFGADRPNRNEYHMGIDIDAPEGTPVKAIADGEIVGYTDFYRGTKMIIVKHALNGQVYYAGYGEVKSGSLESSGINGTPTQNSPIHISAGQVIGKIGNVGGEETMLHFELYSEYPGREVWMANGQKPSWLVDPTAILNQVYQTDSDIFTINAHEEKILNLQRVITSQFTLDGSTETKFFGATDYRNGEFNTYLHSNRSLGGTKVKLKYLSNEHPDVYLLSTPHTSITDLTGQTHTNLNQLNRNDMSLTETADFKLSPDQYKEIPFSNQEAFIKIKAKSAGKFKLIFDDTANTNIGPGEQYKEFFKRTLTVNVEASPYSFQNLSVCQQSQGGCTEVTGDPKSINPDETYKLKAKLVKMNNNVAEPLANKQVKIAIISGEGKVKSEASDNNLFDNSSSTYTTNSSGEISIPFKNKTAGDLKLNLVYQSNNQNLAESNINLSIKPKYSLSVELKDVTSSNELLRELVTDGNLFNEGIYQLKTKLTVANSTNADYLKDKTIELKQTDGIGKLKNC